ncbi:MAG: radical SAM protein [Thermodesulfobacteriota bacterium]
MDVSPWQEAYLRLHEQAALKYLEVPYVYQIARDELYEIDETALAFLRSCDGRQQGKALTSEGDFVEYCLAEDILDALDRPATVEITVNAPVDPSLRYLELHLLHGCNLKCAHCYLGPARTDEMAVADAVAVTRQFSDMGGLRLLISGGEPLLYGDLPAYLAETADLSLRRVLFTNGTLLDAENAARLDVNEIQFSLDGWENGHDALRGEGTFRRTMRGIEAARAAGMAVSFSTMIHRHNLDEFERMKAFMGQVGALEWGIDVLSVAGRLEKHMGLTVPYAQAAPYMAYAYGGGYHGAAEGYACGRHLMAVMPDGRAVKCGFYMDQSLGDARKDLRACWRQMEPVPLSQLECAGCGYIEQCRGGCRFRAPRPLAPDPVMCCLYGVA